MRIIIAGSRDISDRVSVVKAIQSSPFVITTALVGKARGVDSIAESLSHVLGYEIEEHPADWTKYGKPAGMIRNREMALVADGLIAVWDGVSPGTRGMIQIMNELEKPVHLYLVA